ncbi:MAG: hypothetical protein Q9165_008504 [Trypethelium subeluteriae]
MRHVRFAPPQGVPFGAIFTDASFTRDSIWRQVNFDPSMTVSSLSCSGRSTISGDNFILENPANQVLHKKRPLNGAYATDYNSADAVSADVDALGAGQYEIPTAIPTGLDLPDALLIQDDETIAAVDAANIDFAAEMDTEYYDMSSLNEWLTSRVPDVNLRPATQEALSSNSGAITDKDLSQLELDQDIPEISTNISSLIEVDGRESSPDELTLESTVSRKLPRRQADTIAIHRALAMTQSRALRYSPPNSGPKRRKKRVQRRAQKKTVSRTS